MQYYLKLFLFSLSTNLSDYPPKIKKSILWCICANPHPDNKNYYEAIRFIVYVSCLSQTVKIFFNFSDSRVYELQIFLENSFCNALSWHWWARLHIFNHVYVVRFRHCSFELVARSTLKIDIHIECDILMCEQFRFV